MQLLSTELDKVQTSRTRMTFQTVANQYMEVKEHVLSPSTLVGYKGILRRLSAEFLGKNIHNILTIDIQKEMNFYAVSLHLKQFVTLTALYKHVQTRFDTLIR